MSVSRPLGNTKSSVIEFVWGKIWSNLLGPSFLPYSVVGLLAPVMGVLLAIFVVSEQWHLVFALLLSVPSVVLFSTYPFAGLLMWLLFNPFLQVAPTRTFRMVYWIIHRALPPAALCIAVLARLLDISGKGSRVRLGPADAAMAGYSGLGLLNVLWFQSSPLSHLILLYDRVLVPFCLYLLVRFVQPRERDLRRLIPVASVIVLVESAVGILSWVQPQVLPPAWLLYEGSRTVGTLGYPHAYTTTLVFFTFLLFQNAMNREPGLIRFLFFVAFGLSAICIFLSFSRGSWLGALIASTGLLFMYPKAAMRMTIVLLILMVILGGGLLSDQLTFARARLNSVSTAMDRWAIWDAGLQMIGTRPLFGWGYEDYSLYSGQFQRRVMGHVLTQPHASHNSYIGIAAEMGLPALFLFIFPVVWWLMKSVKVWSRMPKEGLSSRFLLVMLWMVILDHVVVNFFSDMRHSTYGMGMWWITLGLIGSITNTYLQVDDSARPKGLHCTGQSEVSQL